MKTRKIIPGGRNNTKLDGRKQGKIMQNGIKRGKNKQGGRKGRKIKQGGRK